MKAAVEGGKKLSQQTNLATKKNDGILMKHNWVAERPRITWDFYSDTVIALYQSLCKQFVYLNYYKERMKEIREMYIEYLQKLYQLYLKNMYFCGISCIV